QPALGLVVGPPGQGKSHLVDGFLSRSPPPRLLVARCRPETELGSQHPLLQLLESDIGEPAPDAIAVRLHDLGIERAEASRIGDALAHSAGVRVSQRLLLLAPDVRTAAIVGAWRRFLTAGPSGAATGVRIDDLHWADAGLVRLVDALGSGEGAGPFIIATARPEMVDSALLRPSHETVAIQPLPPADALALAREASATGALWVERAEGNPLFIIELARSRGRSAELPLT